MCHITTGCDVACQVYNISNVEIPVTPEITSKFGIIWKKGVFVPDQLSKFVTFVKSYDMSPYLPQF